MKTLILTEKPSVARDFAKALNVSLSGKNFFESENYIVTWALGHLLELYGPEEYKAEWKSWNLQSLPIIPETMKMRPKKKTATHLKVLASLLKKHRGKIIVATDAGREGELIARTILAYSKTSSQEIFRFWSSQALTPSVIVKALENVAPLSDFNPLYEAGRARQKADWLVGMNLSRLVSLKLNGVFSIGRVQTAILALIVNRLKEREKFEPKDYFHIYGDFNFKDQILQAIWTDPNSKEFPHRLYEKTLAQQVLGDMENDPEIFVKRKKQSLQKRPPPYLYSLTELQKDANKIFHISAQNTLDIAQKLYEKYKCLSYPRSDSKVLGETSLNLAKECAEKIKKDYAHYFSYWDEKKMLLSNKRVFNDAYLTDHHALIPLKAISQSASDLEKKIFGLVVKRFCQAFSKDYIFEETDYYLQGKKHCFKSSGKVIKEIGWMGLEKNPEEDKKILDLKEGDRGSFKEGKIKDLKTQPPPEYTEALLLSDLSSPAKYVEEAQYKKIFRTEIGLGTQATRAQMIETLLIRKYIIRDKKVLAPTEKGILLIESLSKNSFLALMASPLETAKWEESLEKIRTQNYSETKFLNEITIFIENCINHTKNLQFKTSRPSGQAVGKCPWCQSSIFSSEKTYFCENNTCSFVLWKKVAKKSLSDFHLKSLLEKGETDLIKGFTSKAKKKFSAKLKLTPDGVKFFS